MSQNNLKPVKTSQNQPKPAKTTLQNCTATRNKATFQNRGYLEISASFPFSSLESKFGFLGQEVSTFWSSKKFLSAPYLEVHDFKSGIVFQKFWAQMPWSFWAKKYQIPNINKILSVPCFECLKLSMFINNENFLTFKK